MTNYPMLLVGDLTTFMLIMLILVIISVALSITSFFLIRKFVVKEKVPSIQATTASSEERTASALEVHKIAEETKPPAIEQQPKILESKPTEFIKTAKFTPLGELASMVGLKYLILFNQSGIPIESYNIDEEYRVSASLADFLAVVRKYNPEFSWMISGEAKKVMLLSVGKIGDTEIFAFAVGDSNVALKVEEIRDLLKVYLFESLGRYR